MVYGVRGTKQQHDAGFGDDTVDNMFRYLQEEVSKVEVLLLDSSGRLGGVRYRVMTDTLWSSSWHKTLVQGATICHQMSTQPFADWIVVGPSGERFAPEYLYWATLTEAMIDLPDAD